MAKKSKSNAKASAKANAKANVKANVKAEKSKEEVKNVPAPETDPEPEVKKYDPCRYNVDSCSEDMGCRPNAYPGLLDYPEAMAIVGSESGTYDSLCKLIQGGFRCTDRILMMTPWGNYVVFRVRGSTRMVYFIFDGCTCNVNRFRYYDLNVGTAGLLFYQTTHEVLQYIMQSKLRREHLNRMRKTLVDDICREYSDEFGGKNFKKIC